MIHYLLHVALLLSLCYVVYRLLLQSETYFTFHRWILLAGIYLAFSLPLMEIPASWSLRQLERVGLNPEPLDSPESLVSPAPEVSLSSSLIEVKESPEPNMAPAVSQPLALAEKTTSTAPVNRMKSKESSARKNALSSIAALFTTKAQAFRDLVPYIYSVGVLIFLLNFFIQLFAILYKVYRLPKIKDGTYTIVELEGDEAPYSFWNFIFINPANYEWDVYFRILAHEKIHASQKHSFDMMLAELLVAFQWFNPFAWWYRSAVCNNLEFLTDQTVLEEGEDRERYQWSLLQVSVPQYALSLTSNYNQSILKKRIAMMNTKKSSLHAGWKYLALLSILVFSVLSLNAVRPDLMRSNQLLLEEMSDLSEFEVVEAEAIHSANHFTDFHGKEKNKKKNKEKDKEKNKDKKENKNKVKSKLVQSKTIQWEQKKDDSYNDPTEGRWTAELEKGKVCITFKSKREHRYHNWSMEECMMPGAFKPALTGAAGNFKLIREAGTFTFEGEFDGKRGGGTYTFALDESFRSYLAQQGFKHLESELFVYLAFGNINRKYITFLQEHQLDVDTDELESLAVFRITTEDLKTDMLAFKSIGYRDMRVEDFIEMRIHNVKPEYVNELKAAGVKDLDWDDVVQARIHNVSPAYIKSIQDAGFTDMDIDELTGFAIHGVDAAYIKSFRDMGFRKFDADEIAAAKIHGVTPKFVKALAAAGLGDMDMEDLTHFAIHGVDAAYIKTFQNMGFRNFDSEDIAQAKIHGVTPEFVKSLQAAGLGDIDMEDLTHFAIHHVDAEYIKAFQSMGFRNFDGEDITQAKIHGVTPAYVKSLQAAGLGDMDMEELSSFAIHGVDADYIKTFKSLGFRDFDNEDIIAAKIHGVTPEYVKALESSGLGDMDIEAITSFKIHGVQPEYIADFRKAGFKNFDDEDIISAKIHGMSVEFAKEIIALGFPDADMEDLVELRIHGVTAEYIKKKMDEGYKSDDLEDYLEMKVKYWHQREE